MKNLLYNNLPLNSAYQIFKGENSIWGMDSDENMVWEYNNIPKTEIPKYTLDSDTFDEKSEDLSESVDKISVVLSDKAYDKKYALMSESSKKDMYKTYNELYNSNDKKIIYSQLVGWDSIGKEDETDLYINHTGRCNCFMYRGNLYLFQAKDTSLIISMKEGNSLKTFLEIENIADANKDYFDYVVYNIDNIVYLTIGNLLLGTLETYIFNIDTFVPDNSTNKKTIDFNSFMSGGNVIPNCKSFFRRIMLDNDMNKVNQKLILDCAYNNNSMIISIFNNSPKGDKKKIGYYELKMFSSKTVQDPISIKYYDLPVDNTNDFKEVLVEPYENAFEFYYIQNDVSHFNLYKYSIGNPIGTMIRQIESANKEFVKLVAESSNRRVLNTPSSYHYIGVFTIDTNNSDKSVLNLSVLKNNTVTHHTSIDCETIGTTDTYLAGKKSPTLFISANENLLYVLIPTVVNLKVISYDAVARTTISSPPTQLGFNDGYLDDWSIPKDDYISKTSTDNNQLIIPTNGIASIHNSYGEEILFPLLYVSKDKSIFSNLMHYFYHANNSKLADKRDYLFSSDDSYIASTFNFEKETKLGIVKHKILNSTHKTKIFKTSNLKRIKALDISMNTPKKILSDSIYIYIVTHDKKMYRAVKGHYDFTLFYTFNTNVRLTSIIMDENNIYFIDGTGNNLTVLNKQNKSITKTLNIPDVITSDEYDYLYLKDNIIYVVCRSNLKSFIKRVDLSNDLISTLDSTKNTSAENITSILYIRNNILYYHIDDYIVYSDISTNNYNRTILVEETNDSSTFSSYNNLIHYRKDDGENKIFQTYDLDMNLIDEDFVTITDKTIPTEKIKIVQYPNDNDKYIYMLLIESTGVVFLCRVERQILIKETTDDFTLLDNAEKIKTYTKSDSPYGVLNDLYVSYTKGE